MFPRLRFKKFDGDWTAVTLESLAEVERGKFSVRPRNDPRYFGGEMPFIQTGDVTGSDVYLKGYTQTLNDDGIRVSKVFPADTILITIAANIGDTTITQYPVACPDSVVAIQPKQDKVNTIFLKNVIDLQKDNLDSQATQNAQKNINLQVLKPLKLIVPLKEEQTQIASFLSAVDEKISQIKQKHELLSQYKQGMMQKLFSQQIRFKADDGSEFGEWEDKPLNEIAEITMGSSPKSENYNEDLNGLPLLQGNADIKNRKSLPRTYTSEITKKCNVGDILLSVRAPVGFVATSNHYACIGRGLCSIKAKPNYLQSFIYQWLLSKENSWGSLSQGSTFESVNSDQIKSLGIHIPCLEEQTKIANFLSAIDQKIEVVAQQIEQAKTWKKGLLQQMFV